MRTILLVEDHESIIKGLRYTLAQASFAVTSAATAAEANALLERTLFDLVLLDIMLPDGSGFEICRTLREIQPETPVIFLTAKEEENDVVRGLELGADDYIIKPFRNRELISRITAVLRRYHKEVRELTCGGIRVDLGAGRVYADGEEVSLTALEQKILILLLDHQGQTVTREQILMHIWDYAGNVVNDNTLSVYIKRLREKLGTAQISTVKGIGYRLEEMQRGRH